MGIEGGGGEWRREGGEERKGEEGPSNDTERGGESNGLVVAAIKEASRNSLYVDVPQNLRTHCLEVAWPGICGPGSANFCGPTDNGDDY